MADTETPLRSSGTTKSVWLDEADRKMIAEALPLLWARAQHPSAEAAHAQMDRARRIIEKL